jgi:aspartate/methionine/tyrosine aminotransferase
VTGLASPLPDFRLEVHFSRWEFVARHNLTASDAQTMTVSELLALGSDEDRAAFDDLALGYVPTRGSDRLRAAIASTYATCGPEDVLAFAGAEEAMFWALQLLAEPGEHAVVTVPNYQALETVPRAAGIEVTGVLLDERDDWRLHLDAVEAALRPTTRIVAVNFPNNPTGAVPDAETFAALVELCEERGIRLFSDEVYRGLELDPARTLPQAADLSPTALSLNVLSKSYGLPGLRIGWLACRDHTVLDRLERHKHYTSICNAGPSELLGAIALGAGAQVQARNRAIIAENLPQFDAFFAGHAELFEWAPPHGGCVAFPRYLGAEGVEEMCRELLERQSVFLLAASIYRSDLAPVPEDRFRIGVGRRDPGPALAAFDAYLDRLARV